MVVETARQLCAERVLERSGLDQQAFSSIDNAQASDTDRRNAATDLLNNDGGLESLHAQIDALHERNALAGAGKNGRLLNLGHPTDPVTLGKPLGKLCRL